MRRRTEALQIADEQTAAIRLLVSDVVMLGFTGLQLVEQLAPARPEMKVLFVFTFLAMGGMMLAFATSGMAKAHFGPF